MLSIVACDPDSAEARVLLGELSDALAAITGDDGRSSFSVADVRVARSLFAIARGADGALSGCAACRPLGGGNGESRDGPIGEVKRMYARRGTRGVGAALLGFIEREAKAMGYVALWLETRKVNERALGFYQGHGYTRIPNYGNYIGRDDAVCLGKRLRDSLAT